MNDDVIPFNRPAVIGRELEYMAQAIANGHISGDGPFTKRCQAELELITGARKALLTTSCTHALEMCALLLDIKPGDEVICPSFTFVSTINAFVLRGATPVFVDIRPDTLNINEALIEQAITARTKVIVVVHYAGVACEMDAIMAIAARHGIVVVEDNAHGLFGSYKGRPLGSFGVLSTLSFHETKNVTCGEGGALLINDDALIERAEIIREKGTDRSRFLRGQVDRYTWVELGSSYVLSDLNAAFLLAQLEQRDEIQATRSACWGRYADALSEWGRRQHIRLPVVPDDADHPAHLFYLLMPSLAARTSLITHMKLRRILLVFHYQSLHASSMARRFASAGACPVTDMVSDHLVRLPLYRQLRDCDQDRVVRSLQAWSSDSGVVLE